MLACLAVLGTVTGCTTTGASSYGWLEGRNPAYQRALPTGEVQVRWARDLDSIFLHTSLYKGLYVPVEPARAALSATLDRIYVGTRAGTLLVHLRTPAAAPTSAILTTSAGTWRPARTSPSATTSRTATG